MPRIRALLRLPNWLRPTLGDLFLASLVGWHIRTGEWILQTRSEPTQDLFSFTRAGQPWYAWE